MHEQLLCLARDSLVKKLDIALVGKCLFKSKVSTCPKFVNYNLDIRRKEGGF